MTLLSAPAYACDRLRAVTGHWFPYSYIENGTLKGSAVKTFKAIAQELHLRYDVTAYSSWRRVYRAAVDGKCVVIPSFVWTKDREKAFHFIGPVSPVLRYRFFKLTDRTDIGIVTIANLKRYSFVAVDHPRLEQYVRANALTRYMLLPKTRSLVSALEYGRADLLLMEQGVFEVLLRNGSIPRGRILPVLEAFKAQTYLAVSKSMPVHLVDKIRTLYELSWRQLVLFGRN